MSDVKEEPGGGHLRYLLTAYLLGSISAAGRQEVEAHLDGCAACREELAALQETLGLVQAALCRDTQKHVFEEHRRQRVLTLARNRRGASRTHWGLTALVALLMVVVLAGLLLPVLSTARESSRRVSAAAACKAYAEADGDSTVLITGLRPRPDEESADNNGKPEAAPGQPAQSPVPASPPPPPPPASGETSDIVVPPDILQRAELGDRFEASNPDRSKLDEDVTYNTKNKTGGGGSGGATLDDVIGVGGKTSPGSGGGWGRGTGAGSGSNNGKGTFEVRGGGKALMTKRHGGITEEDGKDAIRKLKDKPQQLAAQKDKEADGEEEDSGRKSVAIAAKDDTIRKQEALIAQQQADAEAAERMSRELDQQNRQLERKNAKEIVELKQQIGVEKNIKDLVAEDVSGQETINMPMNLLDDNAGAPRMLDKTVANAESPRDETSPKAGYTFKDNIRSGGVRAIGGGLDKLSDMKMAVEDENRRTLEYLLGRGPEWKEKGQATPADLPHPGFVNGIDRISGGSFGEAGSIGGQGYPVGGTPGKPAAVNVTPSALESTLRGYLHFQSENPALTLAAYARRPAPVPPPLLTDDGMDEDLYIERYGTRPFVDCARDSVSTFGMDVDTASYTRARACLQKNELPAPDSVRAEEFVNYFKQPYSVPEGETFGVFASGGPSLFGAAQNLEVLKIGIKSREPRDGERKPAALTLVIDTSGSMAHNVDSHTDTSRLDLIRQALMFLVEQLRPEDAVSIVAFNAKAELVLPRTTARRRQRILDALKTLTPGGGTNIDAGLSLGCRMADEAFSPEAVNRMILCSDGVANSGASGPDELLKQVKIFAGRGIDLCTIGFGSGQYNDAMMQRLADSGNGSSHYIDSPEEARRVFTEQLPPNLSVLARDAKVQVEFNKEVIERYRLLGYEKRKIADKDFRNDAVDSGEVGHSTLVTALYLIQRKPQSHGPLGKVYLRWKDAGCRHLPVVERNFPLPEGVLADAAHMPEEIRFLECAAQFAELLRGSPWARCGTYGAVLGQLRQLSPGMQNTPQCRELIDLVMRAQKLAVRGWIKEIQNIDE